MLDITPHTPDGTNHACYLLQAAIHRLLISHPTAESEICARTPQGQLTPLQSHTGCPTPHGAGALLVQHCLEVRSRPSTLHNLPCHMPRPHRLGGRGRVACSAAVALYAAALLLTPSASACMSCTASGSFGCCFSRSGACWNRDPPARPIARNNS